MKLFLAGAAALCALHVLPAAAEVGEVRFARQFSMGYVQFNLIDKLKLLEKYGKEEGVDVKSTLVTFNGPNAMNDGLLSGSVDVVGGGVPGGLTIWAKTRGTAQEVKGIAAFTSQPALLLSNKPELKSLKDFTANDRIALPAVKISVQAVLLEMAAAEIWGQAEYAKLDPITVSLPPPDQTIGLKSGSANFDAVFSVPPFQYELLKTPGIHQVTSSFDIVGPSTFTMSWTSAKFRDANPKVYKALLAALKEATEIANKDPRTTAQAWIDDTKSKLPLDEVAAMMSAPGVTWTMTPQGTMKYATFMHAIGSIKVKADSWKDYFFPDIDDLPGS